MKFGYITYILIIVGVVIMSFVLPTTTSAVVETTTGGNLVATLNPKYPKPGDMVTIKLSSYGYSLENSKVTWFVNRAVDLEGIAKTEHIVRMGSLGSVTTVTILVENSAKKQIVKNLVFQPADIDLIWEADTYIPSDYQGAALPTRGSTVTVTAIPHINDKGISISPTDLIFTWKKDYKTMVRESGRNRDSFTFTLDSDSAQIEVLAQSSDFTLSASGKAVVQAYKPEFILYPIKPLLGRVLQAFGPSFAIDRDVSGFQIEPYFVPNQLVNNKLISYQWSADKDFITISRDGKISLEKISDQDPKTITVQAINTLTNSSLEEKTWSITYGIQNPFFGQ